jgi:hypothetical protein
MDALGAVIESDASSRYCLVDVMLAHVDTTAGLKLADAGCGMSRISLFWSVLSLPQQQLVLTGLLELLVHGKLTVRSSLIPRGTTR